MTSECVNDYDYIGRHRPVDLRRLLKRLEEVEAERDDLIKLVQRWHASACQNGPPVPFEDIETALCIRS